MTRLAILLGCLAAPCLAEEPYEEAYAIFGVTKTRDHVCTPGQKVTISGVENTITLSGPCRVVEVGGQKNRVTIERVDGLVLSGIDLVVTLSGPARAVNVDGQRHSVTLDLVESVTVSGIENVVTWKGALAPGTRVKTDVSGVRNTVRKQKS